MKINKRQLSRIIKEEIENVLYEENTENEACSKANADWTKLFKHYRKNPKSGLQLFNSQMSLAYKNINSTVEKRPAYWLIYGRCFVDRMYGWFEDASESVRPSEKVRAIIEKNFKLLIKIIKLETGRRSKERPTPLPAGPLPGKNISPSV